MSYLTMLLIYRYLAQTNRFKSKRNQAAPARNIGQYRTDIRPLSTCHRKSDSDKKRLTLEKLWALSAWIKPEFSGASASILRM